MSFDGWLRNEQKQPSRGEPHVCLGTLLVEDCRSSRSPTASAFHKYAVERDLFHQHFSPECVRVSANLAHFHPQELQTWLVWERGTMQELSSSSLGNNPGPLVGLTPFPAPDFFPPKSSKSPHFDLSTKKTCIPVIRHSPSSLLDVDGNGYNVSEPVSLTAQVEPRLLIGWVLGDGVSNTASVNFPRVSFWGDSPYCANVRLYLTSAFFKIALKRPTTVHHNHTQPPLTLHSRETQVNY